MRKTSQRSCLLLLRSVLFCLCGWRFLIPVTAKSPLSLLRASSTSQMVDLPVAANSNFNISDIKEKSKNSALNSRSQSENGGKPPINWNNSPENYTVLLRCIQASLRQSPSAGWREARPGGYPCWNRPSPDPHNRR